MIMISQTKEKIEGGWSFAFTTLEIEILRLRMRIEC
jgi:hypothetical protein